MASAGIGPVRLHHATVIHRRKYYQVRLGLGVLQANFIKVQIETDGKSNPAEIALNYRSFPAGKDSPIIFSNGGMVLVINADNGPESNGQRTQWLKRLSDFSDVAGIRIQLAYYPPYHSKYNPIE